ncbi:MAG: ATP synthase F1 subunit delta [Planctomycetaceae bacterium]|jgi:F-type H+-transporting ATPase subunit delta|nr:ATP synthase F1 subunit delta [Planctomycetaceae bacterium]
MQDTAQDARFAAKFNADINAEKIAEVYAQAYLNAVTGDGQSTEDAVNEFASFIGLLQSQKKFADVLSSSMVSNEEKTALLEKVFVGQITPLFWNFLQTVAKRSRLDIIFSIFLQVQSLFDQQSKRIPVVITAAAELDEPLLNSLTEKLRRVLGGEPIIKTVIDPSVIGGLVIRVGDTVYDASIQTQLELVRRQMIERSAQEIQSRRESYIDNLDRQ